MDFNIDKSKSEIISCLMIIAPDNFIIDKPTKEKVFEKKIESMFVKYYQKIFSAITTNNAYEESFEKMFLLLPFFGFG